MRYQDYYETLGVKRDATPEAIQKAYRALARKHHPDVSKEKGAEERFKEINEAYEVLKDQEKRQRYDALGNNWKMGEDFRPPPGFEGYQFNTASGGGATFSGGDFSDFFEALFGGGGASSFFGGGSFGGMEGTRGPIPQPGDSQMVELPLTIDEAVHGGKKSISLQSTEIDERGLPHTTIRSYDVKIPPQTAQGTKIRLAGQGGRGAHGGRAGDILLKVKILGDATHAVAGDDISTTASVGPWDAALGSSVSVRLPDGDVRLTVPAGAQPGQRFRMKGKGLPKRDGTRGDAFVELKVVIPRELTAQQREQWSELRETAQPE